MSKLIAGLVLLAQVACGAVATEYSHRTWRIEDGLPQSRIRAIAQTPDGYLWIGTSEGLARFDGVRFAIFDRANTPALRDDGILSLLLTSDGALWIGTEGGGAVRCEHGAFRSFSVADGLTNGFVRTFYEDRAKNIWVGTDHGFFHLQGERFVRLDGTAEVPLAAVASIAEDAEGRIWAPSAAAGMLSVVNGRLVRSGAGCNAPEIRMVRNAARGDVWAVYAEGAGPFKSGCAAADRSLDAIPIKSVTRDDEGNLWIGTTGRGLLRVRGGQKTWFTAASVLPDNTVNAVFEDREHNLWVGCEDGLLRLSRSSVLNIGAAEGLDDDNAITVYADRRNELWVTTVTGRVFRVSGARATPYRLPAPATELPIRTVFEDRDGTFWFGTARRGLVRQQGNRVTIFTQKEGMRSNSVRQILQDRAGNLWIGHESGLSRWDGASFKTYYTTDGLAYPGMRSMILDGRGDILLGTDGGLNRMHDGRIVRDGEFAALAGEKIWSMYLDTAGTLWLGTRGSGLLRFRAGKITRFTRESGLPSSSVYQILEDDAGKFWMSTSSGVVSVARQELDAAAEGDARGAHFIPYGTADGMATSEMNGGIQAAGTRTAGGELWFPSVRGAVRIDPRRFATRSRASVLVEGMIADNRAIPASGAIAIPAGLSRLEIDFTLCDLVTPQRVAFRYQLEGFDKGWTQGMGGRSAYYTNLPPGRYRFRVMATEADAASNVSEASLPFTLLPFFYQTGWFYGLLALAFGGVIWAGFVLYARQTRARYGLLLAERTRLAREMHDTVIQGCVGVATLLEASMDFRKVDTKEADKLVEDAKTEIVNTLEEARDAVWDLRHAPTLESSVAMLTDLARKLGKEHRIQVETEVTGKGPLDPEIDRTILLVGREALRNAVAHASPKHIAVRLSLGPSEVSMEVSDDGVGFVPRANGDGTNKHFGVVGMRERVEESGGSFRVESCPGKGTKVMARIPVGARRPVHPRA